MHVVFFLNIYAGVRVEKRMDLLRTMFRKCEETEEQKGVVVVVAVVVSTVRAVSIFPFTKICTKFVRKTD